ncbi:MAG TPA: M48 family metalloprotease [Thermoguttaceae bacterium]|nr:M48 family metalloprotease [Thermoguttaceae bacterium]
MGIWYNFGRMLRPRWRKAAWLCQELTGSEAQALRAEEQYGETLAPSLADRFPIDEAPSVKAFVRDIGEYLASHLRKREYRFRFRPVCSPQVNAFALPGGLVFVTRCLLEFCDWNQDEVAFVLAHEIAHVACRHARDKLLTSAVASAWSPSALSSAFVLSEYSKDSELEADSFAVRLLRDSGFDKRGAIRFLRRLGERPTGGTDSDADLGLFSTHPPLEERLANVRKA